MIYFEVSFDNKGKSAGSIRKLGVPMSVYAYEILFSDKKPYRSTVEYEGPEDYQLIAAVVSDYVQAIR